MADLKTGTTVGGQLVWTQGNFPLFPTGNTLLYKTFKVYTENDKPQAIDNDFVSKAEGGSYLKTVKYEKGIQIVHGGAVNGIALYGSYSGGVPTHGIYYGVVADQGSHGAVLTQGTAATYFEMGVSGGWIFKQNGVAKASITTGGTATFNLVYSDLPPTNVAHLTRKDYVDGQINNVTSNANTRVLRAGDVMTGNLSAPNFVSLNLATLPTHVPQLSQVVVKGTVLDYGTY